MENEIKKENNLPPIKSTIIVIVLIIGAVFYTTKLIKNKDGETLSHSARLNPQQQNEVLLQNGV